MYSVQIDWVLFSLCRWLYIYTKGFKSSLCFHVLVWRLIWWLPPNLWPTHNLQRQTLCSYQLRYSSQVRDHETVILPKTNSLSSEKMPCYHYIETTLYTIRFDLIHVITMPQDASGIKFVFRNADRTRHFPGFLRLTKRERRARKTGLSLKRIWQSIPPVKLTDGYLKQFTPK